MTKQKELESMEVFINSLPGDTYIKPWLREVMSEVESMMRSDFPINVSIREAQLAADLIRAAAIEDAKRIVDKATLEAKQIRDAAENRVEQLTRSAVSACHQALRELQR